MTPAIDPTIRAFLETLRDVPPPTSVEVARERERLMQAGAVAVKAVEVRDFVVKTALGPVDIQLVRPAGLELPTPVVFYLHGGGWIVGDRDTHTRLIRDLAHAAQVAVAFIEYARAPEARYPVALEQIYEVARWIEAHASLLEIDRSRLAVAGDSAGGNLAAALTLITRLRGGPRLACQVLFCPALDAGMQSRSHDEFQSGFFLSREGILESWHAYAPDEAARQLPTVSPILADPADLSELPPALIVTAELDPLRDEAEAYAGRLIDAGVPVTATRYLGVIHAFMLINRLAGTPAARAVVAQAGATLRHYLHASDCASEAS